MPRRRGLVNLVFPVGGVHRKFAYQRQPPFTTFDALNVRPRGRFEERTRGGSRPGLARYWPETMPGKINAIASVRYPRSDGYGMFEDNFDSQVMQHDRWVALPSAMAPDGATLFDTESNAYANNGETRGMYYLPPLATKDGTAEFTAELLVRFPHGKIYGSVKLFLMLDRTTPTIANEGFEVEMTMASDGTVTINAKRVSGGSPSTASVSIDVGDVDSGWLRAHINTGGSVLSVFWNGRVLLQQGGWTLPAAKNAMGFSLTGTDANNPIQADAFVGRWTKTDDDSTVWVNKRAVIVGSGFYTESQFTSMLLNSSAFAFKSTPIDTVEFLQRLYIADTGPYRMDDAARDGTLAACAGSQVGMLRPLSVDELAAINAAQDCLEIFSTSIGTNLGTYEVISAANTGAGGNGIITVDLKGGPNLQLPTGDFDKFRITRAYKVYDPNSNTLSRWVVGNKISGSALPTGCELISNWRGRVVLAAPSWGKHLWFMSRTYQADDWNFGASVSGTDASSAVSAENSDAGHIADPITALIPISDDILLFGATRSLWALQGNPAAGGFISNLSREIGVLGKDAWATTPEGFVVVLSQQGLYVISPGRGQEPLSISGAQLPRELRNIAAAKDVYAMLAFDVQDNGVHIFIRYPVQSGTSTHWFFDWENRSFWPVVISGAQAPTAIYDGPNHDPENEMGHTPKPVLLAGRDGLVRYFHSIYELDDLAPFTSYVEFGPLQLGRANYELGMCSELVATLAKDSDDVNWSCRTGRTPEEATTNTALATGTWNAGLNPTSRPRLIGDSMTLKLQSKNGRRWALDALGMVVSAGGKRRL